jgi:hypothetical protein
MAVQPRAKKRSPAQVRAGQAYAAGGRAAQAAKRAEAIKKTGKPPPRSKAQHAASLKAAAAGRAAQQARRQGKTPVSSKARGAVMPVELVLPGSAWPLGCNDLVPTCASVAVACHLQAATGFTMSDEAILKLHQRAGGDNGASIENVLEAIKGDWLAFDHRHVRLLSFFPTDEQCLIAGLVVGVRLPHAGHAVLSAPGGMVSWGRYMPWDGEPEEAWALEWGF